MWPSNSALQSAKLCPYMASNHKVQRGVFDLFPQLITERLVLRKLRASDTDALFKLFSNPQVTRYYDLETFHSPEQAKQLLESFQQRYVRQIGLRWAIALGDHPKELIGTCGYNIWIQAANRAVLGYDLSPTFWHRGIMGEALAAVLDFGFEKMQLNRVEALSFPDNSASQRLLEKLGFHREGLLREYERTQGHYQDMTIYALLARDRL